MRERIKQVRGLDQLSRRLIALGVVLVVGSLSLAGWLVISGELVTGLTLLLYVVVGTLLAAIGFSPSVGAGPNQRA